ncbi:MAG: metallophosphoesterase [Oscillospiraceae bacterium]|nr:metallophosphoesterase [Oscillospiraceae bacterium]
MNDSRIAETRYTLNIDNWPRMRIALVSDLHDRSGEQALEMLWREKPELIAAVGDMLEARKPEDLPGDEREIYELLDMAEGPGEKSSPSGLRFKRAVNRLFAAVLSSYEGDCGSNSNAISFLKEAAKIAPLCFSPGNHERYISAQQVSALKDGGLVYLDNSDAVIAGLVVGGLSSRPDLKWLEAFGKKRGSKLLLCHHPEYWRRYVSDKSIDLTLSGHAHGGQWRVGGRGLFAPGQGLLPRYTRGVFFGGRLVVGAGLSNPSRVPRINNSPELVFLNINPGKR